MSKLSIIKAEGENIRNTLDLFWIVSNGDLFQNEDLCGACAISAVALSKRLNKLGIKAKVKTGNYDGDAGHAWVETDKYLVDLTYTQFDGSSPKVLILDKKSRAFKRHMTNWDNVKVKRNFSDWGGEEHPSNWKYVVQKVKETSRIFDKIKLKNLPR